MYTRRIFPVKGVIKWTRRHIILFLILGTIPVVLFDIVGLKWLHVPWLPLGVLGTAVAFIVSFKNNASYDRLWEARKIWGGIVNASRSFAMMVNDFITNEHAKKAYSEEELFTLQIGTSSQESSENEDTLLLTFFRPTRCSFHTTVVWRFCTFKK